MIFRQLFDPPTSTYTYLLADAHSREAVLIDPVAEQLERDVELLAELDLRLLYTLETHVHADHVTASGSLRARLGAKTAVSSRAGPDCGDIKLAHGDMLAFGRHALQALHTPGHTHGDVSYLLADGSRVFTGDTLLIRGCGRTDFQQGDASALYRSVMTELFSLPDATLVYPGHDYRGFTVSTIGEERQHNPRLGGDRDEASFVALMAELKLAPPARLEASVPANLRCGMPVQAAGG